MAGRPLSHALAGFSLAHTLFDLANPRILAGPARAAAQEPVPAAGGRALPSIPTQRLFGVRIADLTRDEVVARLVAWAGAPPTRIVVTANLDKVMRLRHDAAFRAVYRDADLVTADGKPFVWLSRREGRPLRERVAGSDLVVPVARAAARAGKSLFLFGPSAERLAAAAAALRRAAPRLDIRGILSPPLGFERDPAIEAAVVATLRAARPDIIVVALGSPEQELWSHRTARALESGVFLNVGAGLDALVGDMRRAPPPMRRPALDRAWHAMAEARRLAQRNARSMTALPALYAWHRRDLAESEAERLRRAMAAETEARFEADRADREAAQRGAGTAPR